MPAATWPYALGTAQWLDGLSGKIGSWRNMIETLPNLQDEQRDNALHVFDLITNLVKNSGLEDVSGFGMSSLETEPGLYRTKMVLHHYPGRGNGFIWSDFGASPHALYGVDLLPTTTAFAGFGDVDAAAIWSGLEKDLTDSDIPGAGDALEKARDSFEQGTGLKLDDVLNSLGGEFGFIVTLNDSKIVTLPGGQGQPLQFPEPGIVIVAKVKDDLIFNRVADVLKSGKMPVTETDKDGLKMRTVTVPLPLPMTLKPSIARSGDYLFLATSDDLIQEVLAVKSGKEDGLKSTDEFKKLAKDVPDQGNRFAYVSKKFGQTIQDIQQQIADRQSDRNPMQGKIMRKLAALNPPADGYSVAANTTEGWMVTANGSQDTAKLVLMPAIAVPAVLAGIAVPNFVRARAKAQETACLNNRRMIQSAKRTWAQNNGKSDQDTPTWEDLKPYLGGRTITCPSGGKYEINAVGEQVTCSVHGS